MASLPRYAIFQSKRCRVLYYAGDDSWRILLPDDTQRTVYTSQLRIIG